MMMDEQYGIVNNSVVVEERGLFHARAMISKQTNGEMNIMDDDDDSERAEEENERTTHSQIMHLF